jgi:glycosyltransferase involved in cell wall biosynthesis
MNQGAKDLGGATEEGRALGPDVQVFIPVFNDLDYFPEALTSVLRQRNVRYEVVVSDNASTDGTYEYAQRAAEQDQRIKLHHNDTNIGLIGNLNRFADLVSAPFYMILCSDDVLLSDSALQKAVEAMTHDSTVVSVYCDLEYIDGKSRHLGTRHFGRDGYFDGAKALRQSIVAQRNLFGIPLLNRTEVCGDLRYPQELTYTSDVYISAKLASRGKLYHIPELLIGNRYTGRNATSALLAETWPQFQRLTDLFDVALTTRESLIRGVNRYYVPFAKTAFLFWARIRS